ncbi:MAG: retropepsin-like aspartic protease [Actinomycetota bacterium]
MPLSFDDITVTGIWDTGASLTAIDQTFADEHSSLFEPLRESVGFDANGVEMATTIARMAEITVAGRRFEPSACAIVDLGPLNEAIDRLASADGRSPDPMSVILGMPVIASADWWFDFPARRWALVSG